MLLFGDWLISSYRMINISNLKLKHRFMIILCFSCVAVVVQDKSHIDGTIQQVLRQNLTSYFGMNYPMYYIYDFHMLALILHTFHTFTLIMKSV